MPGTNPTAIERAVAITGAIALNTAKVTNATHTGEVTGSAALTVDKTAITNRTNTPPSTGDNFLYADATDGDALKRTTLDNLALALFAYIYPVGCIYTSIASANPSTIFGGTWVAFGTGRTLVGIDAGDTAFDTVEETGGAKTKTIAQANLPDVSTGAGTAHTHVQNAHDHSYTAPLDSSTFQASAGADIWLTVTTTTTGSTTATNQNEAAHTHSLGGSGTALDVVNPYVVVYMWKRTA